MDTITEQTTNSPVERTTQPPMVLPDLKVTTDTPYDKLKERRAALRKTIEDKTFRQITGTLDGVAENEKCFVGMGAELLKQF